MLEKLLYPIFADRPYTAPAQMRKLTRLCVLDRREQSYLVGVTSDRARRNFYSFANILDVSVDV